MATLAAELYKHRVSAPKTALDWVLALSDPLSMIGQDFYALLMKKSMNVVARHRFQDHLALVTLIKQQRVEEQLRRELEYNEDQARVKLLQSWAASQLKTLPADEMP